MNVSLGSVEGRVDPHPLRQGPGLHSHLYVSSFYGGTTSGRCIQLTVGDQFVQLDAGGCAALKELLAA
jgi:hypothetical protein